LAWSHWLVTSSRQAVMGGPLRPGGFMAPTPCSAAAAMERSDHCLRRHHLQRPSMTIRQRNVGRRGTVRSRGLSPMPTNPCQRGDGRTGARLSAARVPQFVQHFSLRARHQWCDHPYHRALHFARSSEFPIEPTDSIISASLRLSRQTSRTPDSSLDQGSWLPRGSRSAATELEQAGDRRGS
jgi:hypothetical protein